VARAVRLAGVVVLIWSAVAAGQSRDRPSLKDLPPQQRVTAVTFCRGAYDVTLADGSARTYNEYDLALKIDSSPNGPTQAKPALVPTGRVGDRAFLVFATLEELRTGLKPGCRE
jgi:cytochrome c